jgi:hypothetical protein
MKGTALCNPIIFAKNSTLIRRQKRNNGKQWLLLDNKLHTQTHYMKYLRFTLLIISFLIVRPSYSQFTKVSQNTKDNFRKQYPNADDVEWKNEVLTSSVSFKLKGRDMVAEYSSKGIWKSTSKGLTMNQLPAAIKDGFKKSKYADRTILDIKMISYPANVIQYRIKTGKNEVEKKYLFFNEDGQLIRETITI